MFWVPLTQHCLLEAATEGRQISECEHSPDGSCARDGCTLLEGGSYKLDKGTVKAVGLPSLAFANFQWIDFATELLPSVISVPDEELLRPFDWVPAWHFLRRTAPPARAPCILG